MNKKIYKFNIVTEYGYLISYNREQIRNIKKVRHWESNRDDEVIGNSPAYMIFILITIVKSIYILYILDSSYIFRAKMMDSSYK